MKEDQIKIEKIKLQQIDHFAHQALNQAPYQTDVPISRRRALSQLHNPYGRPDDVALLVALHDNKCVGYQGLLPGLFSHHKELKRIHWSTAFFVSPDYRGTGVAGRLLAAIKTLDIDFPVTRMTQSAQQAYLKAGFKQLGQLTYYQLRMEKVRKLETIVQEAQASLDAGSTADALYRQSKKILYRRLLSGLNQRPDAFTFRQVTQITPQAQQLIRKQLNGPRFFRGIEALNWMLKYRWLISAAPGHTETEPYYFSLVSELFDYIALEIYSADNKAFKGFLILSVLTKKGRTRVKILDFAVREPADGSLVVYLALRDAQKYSADRLDFPASLLGYFGSHPHLQPLIKEQQRLYLFYPKSNGSVLEGCAGRIMLDYCDADTTFT